MNPYDATQRPVVAVQSGDTGVVRITWQPDGAQVVRVYVGAQAGDGYDASLVWSVVATEENSLRSGLAYGDSAGGAIEVPSRPLASGATYTAHVTRADPRGSGDGFTNTNNRYVGTAVFTAP